MKNKIAILLSIFMGISMLVQAQLITTIVGTGTSGFLGDGGPATLAELYDNAGIAIDGSGNIYIADALNYRIRKVSPAGIISTIAGNSSAGYSGDGGAATDAEFTLPVGIALDISGNIYIADEEASCVRKIIPSGTITTIAGTGFAGYSGDGIPATMSRLSSPTGVAVDSSSNVYIADGANNRVRKVTPSGIISTIAGTGTAGYTGDGGAATAEEINGPWDITLDASGNLYIADRFNNRIRKVSTAGIISTIAGTGVVGYSGDGGAATAALLHWASGITLDSCGNFYLSDQLNNCVRKITPAGIISTIAGTGTLGYSGDGGPATAAELHEPSGIAVAAGGNVLISDQYNYRIRMVTAPPAAVGPISGLNTVCTGEAITLSDTSAGGTWSGGMAATATVGSTGTVTGVAAGTAVISYSVINRWCNMVAVTDTITVNPLPHAGSISGIDSVCPGDTVTLAETVTGGVWGIINPSVASITATGKARGIESGKDTVRYIYTNTCGSDTAIFPIIVRHASSCPTGIQSIANQAIATLSVFPNPNNGAFTLNISSSTNVQAHITITNVLGEKVEEWTIETNKETDIILDAPAGIYFVGVVTKDGMYNAKVVVAP